MKITTGLALEIRRSGEFMSGAIVMNGVRQDLRVIPRDVEFEDLMKFFSVHVVPMILAGKHGSVSYKKGKTVQ